MAGANAAERGVGAAHQGAQTRQAGAGARAGARAGAGAGAGAR